MFTLLSAVMTDLMEVSSHGFIVFVRKESPENYQRVKTFHTCEYFQFENEHPHSMPNNKIHVVSILEV
jgi:hypothetical protein